MAGDIEFLTEPLRIFQEPWYTGFPELDAQITSHPPWASILIVGPPTSGRTSVALRMAHRLGKALYIHTELTNTAEMIEAYYKDATTLWVMPADTNTILTMTEKDIPEETRVVVVDSHEEVADLPLQSITKKIREVAGDVVLITTASKPAGPLSPDVPRNLGLSAHITLIISDTKGYKNSREVKVINRLGNTRHPFRIFFNTMAVLDGVSIIEIYRSAGKTWGTWDVEKTGRGQIKPINCKIPTPSSTSSFSEFVAMSELDDVFYGAVLEGLRRKMGVIK